MAFPHLWNFVDAYRIKGNFVLYGPDKLRKFPVSFKYSSYNRVSLTSLLIHQLFLLYKERESYIQYGDTYGVTYGMVILVNCSNDHLLSCTSIKCCFSPYTYNLSEIARIVMRRSVKVSVRVFRFPIYLVIQ